MIKYICNNKDFSQFPSVAGFNYSALFKLPEKSSFDNTECIYMLVLSDKPLSYYSVEDCPMIQPYSKFKTYLGEPGRASWMFMDEGGGDQYAMFIPYDIFWVSEDIYYYSSSTIWYNGSNYTLVSDGADSPIVTVSPSGKCNYIKNCKPITVKAEATSPDGGEITYEWREMINNGSGPLISNSQYFSLPSNYVGQKKYYCCIFNNKNNTRTFSEPASIITVNVKESTLSLQAIMIGWFTGKRLVMPLLTKQVGNIDK